MKKIRKVQLIAAALGTVAVAVGVSALKIDATVETKASTATSTFAMADGASVRAEVGTSGIRWETSVTKAWFDSVDNIPASADNVSFGTFVTAASNVDSVKDVTKDTDEVTDIPCAQTSNFFKDGDTFTYYSAITYNDVELDDQTAAYATELIARSYVKYSTDDGATYTYVYADATDSQRCMRAIALEAYKAGDYADLVKGYLGKENTSENFGGYYETANPDTVDSSYTVAYAGAKKVGTLTGGTLTLDGLKLGDTTSLNLFTDAGDYAFTDEFQYVTQALTNANFATVLNSTEEDVTLNDMYYALAEDIALTDTWTSVVTFTNSTLDGNGYRITGLKPSEGSSTKKGGGLFYAIQNATFKNLSVEGVTISGKGRAAFAWGIAKGTSYFENVYVSFLPGLFNYDNIGGLIAQQRRSSSVGDAVVTDCVIYMPEHAGTSGFVVGNDGYDGTITIKNSTFIGGNGAVQGEASPSATVTQENTVITDAVAAHKTINEKEAKDVTFAETAYRADHPYVELTADNFGTVWTELEGDEIIAMTANPSSSSRTDFNNLTKINFSGVFDGQGYSIGSLGGATNYDTRGWLFGELSGSVKNLICTEAKLGSSKSTKSAAIARTIPAGATAYIENVGIMASRMYSSDLASPICQEMNGGLVMKNVVVYLPSTLTLDSASVSLLGKLSTTGTVTTENCYFVDEKQTSSALLYTGDDGYVTDASTVAGLSGIACFNVLEDGTTAGSQLEAYYAGIEAELPEPIVTWLSNKNYADLKKSQA